MRIDLKEIMAKEASVYPFEYSMDLSGLELYGDHPFTEPVSVRGKVENRAGVLELKASVDTDIHYRCSRCAKDSAKKYHTDVFHVLSSEGEDSDIDDVFPIEGTEVDVDSAVKSAVILNYDMVNLCRPDCRGLCPICGADLNDGDCGCSQKNEGGALSRLGELLDKMKNE